jgi:RNA polymerase sigma-70 factor (ECF subfamily)
LDRLVLDHLGAALLFATRLTGDRDAAEDIVQEALLRAVRRLATFRGEAQFRTWLFQIIVNVFRDRLRASQAACVSIEQHAEDLRSTSMAGPAEAAIQAELEAIVGREVSRLPPRQREVLVLSAYEQFSTRQIAAVVGISEANVYSTLSAARWRLKTRLAPYFGSVEK